jgi:hypothetical protein
VVVLGVDDLLLLPRAPRVRAGRPQQQAVLAGEREQARARRPLARERIGEVLATARGDLDLGADQLARDRTGEHVVGVGVRPQLVVALDERARLGIEDRELLLDADREVLGGLEDLRDLRHVQHDSGPR